MIFKNRFFPHAATLALLSMTGLHAFAGEDEMTRLSIQIVQDYRELRASCADQEGEARKMCYYRLRIGLWDYKQARQTLTNQGIHLQSQTQVADANP